MTPTEAFPLTWPAGWPRTKVRKRVQPTAALDAVQAAYRALARQHHPDRGGDVGAMASINRAWEQARAALGIRIIEINTSQPFHGETP